MLSTDNKAAATVAIDVCKPIEHVTISCSGFMDCIPCMGKTFSQGYKPTTQIRLPIQIPESVEKGIVRSFLAPHAAVYSTPMPNVSPHHLCY